MSPKERYWELFDKDLEMKSLPKGFTDQAGLFDQTAVRIRQELAGFSEIPSSFPDSCPMSKQDILRIDKETQDIHFALNYPSASSAMLLDTTIAQANRNNDACAVYNRLNKLDQERIELHVKQNMFGKPTYVLERKALFPGRYTMDIPFRPSSNPTHFDSI